MPSYEKVIADQACLIADMKAEIKQLWEDDARCQENLAIVHERCANLEKALESKR